MMAFQFTPLAQQPQQQPSLFQTPTQQPQQSPFTQTSPFPQQTPQLFQQQQNQLFLFTNYKTPATYSTKWSDLHPDSQKFLLQIEERILEYRDESQRLDHCSRLYDSSVSNDAFELDASRIVQELGGIRTSMARRKAQVQELMAVVKEMLRNTEVAVRSFMLLRQRFVYPTAGGASNASAPSQTLGSTLAPSASQPTATSIAPIFDFYTGLQRKPSPFLLQTVSRFKKYLGECRQWIEELEQLLLLDSEQNSFNSSSSLLQSLPKVMSNLHDFFVHVAAKVESIHQSIESMKAAYLADRQRRGDMNDPFMEADRRETAKQEAAVRCVNPTLHLPAVSQSSTQVAGLFASSATPGVSTAPNTSSATSSALSGGGTSLFSTPSTAASSSSLVSTPTASAPGSSLFGPAVSPQTPIFSSLSMSTPAISGATAAPLFGPTPAFSNPFATGGSGANSNAASKTRAKSRTGRR